MIYDVEEADINESLADDFGQRQLIRVRHVNERQ